MNHQWEIETDVKDTSLPANFFVRHVRCSVCLTPLALTVRTNDTGAIEYHDRKSAEQALASQCKGSPAVASGAFDHLLDTPASV